MNGSVAVAIWEYSGGRLAYTRLGIDRAWIDLKETLLTSDRFQDVVAYKDGLFCAVDFYARKVVALDFSSAQTVRSTDLTLNLPAYRDRDDGWTCFQEARLVNSSSKLFLVRWRSLINVGETKRREVDVYKLMDDDDKRRQEVGSHQIPRRLLFLPRVQSVNLIIHGHLPQVKDQLTASTSSGTPVTR
ncbi:uncharacterized protein A4U43_C07F33220 [Asparagus officinalis]|uniref:KIB1-4 beta-propeller domain-containing protein n=1 Tax=Asparagus officinalis TaxID=4686 RepID=A0A5P1EH64_ASPOF|nr:uncharacterized protein A4U43_C07F33220 [Asparagus officinalis]